MKDGSPHDHIRILEEDLAKESPPSATPGRIARQVLGLPPDVRGLTVYDLASGQSSLVAELIEEGANAHAVDILYGDPAMEEKVKKYLQVRLNRIHPENQEKMAKLQNEALSAFFPSFKQHRNRYHADYLTRLSAPDEVSDWTVSINGILTLAQEPDVMLEAMKEAIRITKPKGRIVVAPLNLEDDEYYNYFGEEHEALMDQIKALNVGEVIIERHVQVTSEIPHEPMNRLVIVKY